MCLMGMTSPTMQAAAMGPDALGFILAPKPNTEVVVPALTRFCTYTVAPIGRQGGSPSNRWSIVGIGMERCT